MYRERTNLSLRLLDFKGVSFYYKYNYRTGGADTVPCKMKLEECHMQTIKKNGFTSIIFLTLFIRLSL